MINICKIFHPSKATNHHFHVSYLCTCIEKMCACVDINQYSYCEILKEDIKKL